MSLQTVILLLIIAAAVGLFFLGRELFQRGVRMKNRLQMSAIYTANGNLGFCGPVAPNCTRP